MDRLDALWTIALWTADERLMGRVSQWTADDCLADDLHFMVCACRKTHEG